jgi:hypothetical protein
VYLAGPLSIDMAFPYDFYGFRCSVTPHEKRVRKRRQGKLIEESKRLYGHADDSPAQSSAVTLSGNSAESQLQLSELTRSVYGCLIDGAPEALPTTKAGKAA